MDFIFASDLDQTLIYSHRFLENFSQEEKNRVDLVEIFEEREISFISKFVKEEIKKIIPKNLFIPVTTRTIAQFSRIKFFSQELNLKYAITSNGGNILVNGERSEEWQDIIENSLKTESIDKTIVLEEFNKIRDDSWSKECILADDLFYYSIIEKTNIPWDKFELFSLWLDKKGWVSSIQGRKMYFVPKCVDKWIALKYIADLEKGKKIISSGDSKLDVNMIINSTIGIVPSHGQEAIEFIGEQKSNIHITETKGIFAADEIIRKVLLELE